MMIDPPIEELKKIAGNEYILSNVVAKRAKMLEKDMPEYIEASQEKAISIAARELYAGKLEIKKPEDLGE
jgi:DNA-directed RNA polymerase omega subunit